MLLGEAESKVHHIASAPILPEASAQLHRMWLIKGAQATTAIEGNTLSEDEVLAIYEKRSTLPKSRAYLGEEVLNVLAAMDRTLLSWSTQQLSIDLICQMNAQILHGLDLDPGVIPGKIRTGHVHVGHYVAPTQEHVHVLLQRFVRWEQEFEADRPFEGRELAWSVLKAVLSHILFVWIHPFAEGNGRTARLLELKFLLAAGVPTPAAHLLSNHFNRTRDRYYRALDRSREESNIMIFAEYAIRGFVDGLQEQIDSIQSGQFSILWGNLVRTRVAPKTEAQRRQQEVALALESEVAPIDIVEIPNISPSLARRYAGKSRRVLMRDINRLKALGLVVAAGRGAVEIDRGLMLQMLPTVVREPSD